jgi:hypothetical protein
VLIRIEKMPGGLADQRTSRPAHDGCKPPLVFKKRFDPANRIER